MDVKKNAEPAVDVYGGNGDAGRLSLADEMRNLEELLSGRYRLIRELGKGAQGKVFLAENVQTRQKVAIKRLQIQSVKDWKLYDLFHREAETLRRLEIPGVAKLHETLEFLDTESPVALIIQDYLDGDPMQSFIAKGHRFRIEQIGEILLQLTDILEKLHHSDPVVIHRDLKPSNIILRYEENKLTPTVHIIDFGAVSNPQVKGGGSTVVGTYGYMAPEQLMGRAEPKSDIYSLAIVAVYLMSGVAPENLEVEDFRVLIDAHLEHLPHEITVFLRSMLEPKCDNRMGDYAAIRRFFDAIRKQEFHSIPTLPNQIRAKVPDRYSLANVSSYRQAGNVELWLSLPDKTPRKVSKQLINSLGRNGKVSKRHKLMMSAMPKRLIFLVLCVCVVFLACTVLDAFGMSKEDMFFWVGLGSCFGLIWSVMNWSLICDIFGLKSADDMEQEADANSDALNSYREHLMLLSFLRNARKSMATLVRIEYCPFSTSDRGGEYDGMATWILTYSFNPPDDLSPDPLVHKFTTHAIPDTLKEGDLIPILYRIVRDARGEHVYSMPYPVANCDVPVLAGK